MFKSWSAGYSFAVKHNFTILMGLHFTWTIENVVLYLQRIVCIKYIPDFEVLWKNLTNKFILIICRNENSLDMLR